jgi:hypothetical protein
MAGTIRDANTLKAIRDRMVSQLKTIDSLIDTQQGSPVKDIVVDSPSVEIRGNFVVLDYIMRTRNLDSFLNLLAEQDYLEDLRLALGFQTTDEVIAMVESDLDDFADTFGITRIVARKALYLQRFYRNDNNSGAPVTIPLGTEVKTPDGLVSAVTITSVGQVPIIEATTGLYYVEETAEATATGTDGNVALGTFTSMTPVLAQAISTSNVSLIQSGVDEESNGSLIERIKEARKGRNYPTTTGLRRLATGALDGSSLDFVDAKVIGPSDPLMTRVLAGGVDIYVVGKSIVPYTEVIVYATGHTEYVLSVQPVETLSSVTTSSGVLPYTFYSDVTGAFAGSTRALSSITLTSIGDLADGDAISVQYSYDGAIRDAQSLVSEGGEFHAPAMDALFRQARQAIIDVSLEVIQFGDRTQAEVQTDVQSDLAAFFDGGTTSQGIVYTPRTIGEDIDVSDIIALIADISDVDRITLTGAKALVLEKNNVVVTESQIVMADYEYARLGTVTFL